MERPAARKTNRAPANRRKPPATTSFPIHIRATGLPIETSDRDYVRRKRISEIGELEGKYRWEGSLDDLRLREPAAE